MLYYAPYIVTAMIKLSVWPIFLLFTPIICININLLSLPYAYIRLQTLKTNALLGLHVQTG
jgi:hypothetical protein